MTISLPPDLLILSHINRLQDRLPLLHVCKSWYNLLLPTVYPSITIEYTVTLINLIYAIHRNPRLGACIRTVYYPTYFSEGIKTNEKYYDAALLRDVITHIAKDAPELEQWGKRLDSGDEDAWLSLLLLGLENVKSLDMGYDMPYIFRTAECIVRPSSDCEVGKEKKKKKKATALQHLESIRIWTEDSFSNTFCARGFAPFFLLPAMKVFRAVKVHEELEYIYKSNRDGSDSDDDIEWDRLFLPATASAQR